MGCGEQIGNAFSNPGGGALDGVKNTLIDIRSEAGKIWDPSKDLTNLVNDTGLGDLVSSGMKFVDVISGKYHSEAQELQDLNEKYENLLNKYQSVVDRINSTYVINEEIFLMSAKNKNNRELEPIIEQVEQLGKTLNDKIREFNDDYKDVNNALKTTAGQILLWFPMVIGGLINDTQKFLTEGDWEAGRALLNTAINIALIVIELIGAFIALLGGQVWLTGMLVTAATAQLVNLIITVDNRYAQGILTKALFSFLDVYFNDILQFERLGISQDTYKFGDSEYYNEMVGYTQMALTIVSILANLSGMLSNPSAYKEVMKSATSSVTGNMYSAVMGAIPGSSYLNEILVAYNVAQLANDVVGMEDNYQKAKKKLEEYKEGLDKKMATMRFQKMANAYREVEDMLNYTSNIVAEYALSGFSNPTSSYDPEMVIAANFGYRYSGDNFGDFGIDIDKLSGITSAGSDEYVKNILFRV